MEVSDLDDVTAYEFIQKTNIAKEKNLTYVIST